MTAGPGPAAIARQAAAGHIARFTPPPGATGHRGCPRVTAQLAREGITVNHKAGEREMARQGLAGRCSRRKIRTTRRDPDQAPVADLAHRVFTRPRTDPQARGHRPRALRHPRRGWPASATGRRRPGRYAGGTSVNSCSYNPSGWASDPTVSRAIEALAGDAPAALKAIDTTARAKARAVVSGREMGQPRIAVVSRVNWRWPISL
jgi:hypothetical protein